MKIRPAAIIIAYLSALLSLALYVQECRGDSTISASTSVDGTPYYIMFNEETNKLEIHDIDSESETSLSLSEIHQALDAALRIYYFYRRNQDIVDGYDRDSVINDVYTINAVFFKVVSLEESYE